MVDARPVTFPSRVERQLRTGFLLDLPLGAGVVGATVGDDEDADAGTPRTVGSRSRRRLQISAAHTWLIASSLVARPGGAPINLLSRAAIGFGALGQARHRFDASITYAERGLGARLSLQSRGASFIEAGGAADNVLRFTPLATLGMRAWVQGERIAPRSHWLRGARISLVALNIADARDRAEDRFGATPLSYQARYRDPVDRSIELEFRKKF